jgi:hypothetical protein
MSHPCHYNDEWFRNERTPGFQHKVLLFAQKYAVCSVRVWPSGNSGKKIRANLAFALLLCYIPYQYRQWSHPFAFKASGYLILKEEQA